MRFGVTPCENHGRRPGDRAHSGMGPRIFLFFLRVLGNAHSAQPVICGVLCLNQKIFKQKKRSFYCRLILSQQEAQEQRFAKVELCTTCPQGGAIAGVVFVEVRMAGVSRFPVQLLLSSVDGNSGVLGVKGARATSHGEGDQGCAGRYRQN